MTALPFVVIRQAVPADASELARMRWADSTEDEIPGAQPFAAFHDDFVAFVQSALQSDQWTVWVAEMDGPVVAHIYVHFVGKVPRPGRLAARWGYMTAVYAVPEIRNRGIGSQLLRHVINWASEQQLELLLVWPSTHSVPFYKRAGFITSPDDPLERHLL